MGRVRITALLPSKVGERRISRQAAPVSPGPGLLTLSTRRLSTTLPRPPRCLLAALCIKTYMNHTHKHINIHISCVCVCVVCVCVCTPCPAPVLSAFRRLASAPDPLAWPGPSSPLLAPLPFSPARDGGSTFWKTANDITTTPISRSGSSLFLPWHRCTCIYA